MKTRPFIPTKLQIEVWHNVLILKRFILSHLLMLICCKHDHQAVRDEIAHLVEADYLIKDDETYQLTSDYDKRFDLLEEKRRWEKHYWDE